MTHGNIVNTTFTVERTFEFAQDVVFSAWADPAAKARWFAGGGSDYELDFRPDGFERNSSTLKGKHITWEALYRDIAHNERIVYTSVLCEENTVATASLTTVEFFSEGDCTHLILVEFGAFLDGREQPAWREQGTGEWLNALGEDLERQAGVRPSPVDRPTAG